jgi:putative membrane protein
MKVKKRVLAILGSSLLVSVLGFAQSAGTSPAMPSAQKPATADRTFMEKAAQGGMAEVALGKLAEQNGQSQGVKDFGKRMVTDHSKANDQLKQIASQQGVTLPTEMSAEDNATKDRLSQLHGEAFDKAYMKDMVADHRKDISEFKKESTSGKDPQVKEWASQTLPTLESHLKMAEQVQAKVGGSSTNAKSEKSGQSASASRNPSSQPQ